MTISAAAPELSFSLSTCVPVTPDFWLQPTEAIARQCLGMVLVSTVDDKTTVGRIVETEAYITGDPASHSYRGKTKRNESMFGSPGLTYVYFIYGNHWCLNFTANIEGVGEAVLIRALQPLEGMETMVQRRGRINLRDLCSGPGKLCQALGITRQHNAHNLAEPPLQLLSDGTQPGPITVTGRVGLSVSADLPLRYYLTEQAFWVSRK